VGNERMITSHMEVTKGDCWMIHDSRYSKKEHIIPDSKVKVICFDRPCIVLSTTGELATVIPLTSKKNPWYPLYPVQIEENRMSYALLSQITTMEKRKLSLFIGRIKDDVFEDIQKNLFQQMGEKKSGKSVERKVARCYNQLDIHRFYSFHIYKMKDSLYTFMAVRYTSNKFLEIPVILPWNKQSLKNIERYSTVFFGYLNYDKTKPLDYQKYKDDVLDLGFEYHRSKRERIIEKVKEYFQVTVRDIMYEDRKLNMTRGLSHIYGSSYFKGYQLYQKIQGSTRAQTKFLSQPMEVFPAEKEEDIQDLFYDFFQHLNPLICPTKCFEYLKQEDPVLLENYLEAYEQIFILENIPGLTKEFEGEKLHDKYSVKNLKWMYNYFMEKKYGGTKA